MGDTPDQIRQGDELTASRLNEWAGYASGVPLEVGDGLESASGSKRLLAARRARPIVAKLTGSSSPYSWTSQANTAAGTYANHAITGTTNAYEVNGVSGLASKVVRLYPDGHGKYNFQYLNCCSSGCATGSLAFTVTGCSGAAVSGATVSVTGPGGFSASGTTNGSGQVTFSVVGYPAGSYSWTVSLAPRYNSASGTKTVTCGVTNSVSVSLSAASGYTCITGCCGSQPIKDNLFLTTPFGTTVAFDYNALGGSKWEAVVVENIACRKDAGCATSSTEACSFYYSMGTGCSPSGNSAAIGVGSGGYDISTSPPTMICDAANTCSNRAVSIVAIGNSVTCSPFTTTATARFVYSPSTGVTNDYGTISVTE